MEHTPHPAIAVESDKDTRRLVLAGSLGLNQAAELHQTALDLATGASDVEIDWRQATYIGAAPLQVLLALQEELAARGRTMTAFPPNAELGRGLEVAGVISRFVPDGESGDLDAQNSINR